MDDYITQLGANVDWIAQGAAQGGHRDYAEELRTQVGADVNMIAKSAAFGGHRDYAEILRMQFGIDVNQIAIGAVLGGDWAYTEKLRMQYGADIRVIRTYALGAYRRYLQDIIMFRALSQASENASSRYSSTPGLFSAATLQPSSTGEEKSDSIADYNG